MLRSDFLKVTVSVCFLPKLFFPLGGECKLRILKLICSTFTSEEGSSDSVFTENFA